MSRNKLQRGIHAAALVASVSLVLAGCAGGGDPEATGEGGDGGKITLRFAWWGSDSRHAMTEEMIDLFEEQNPNITIESEPGAWDAYWDALATKAATGEMPDVIQTVDPYVLEYGRNGQLADLTQFGDVLDLSPYSEEILTDSSEDGKVWGVPGGLTTFSVWTNPDVLEAAGVEMPDDDTWSWQDYAEFSKDVSEAVPDAVGSGQISFYPDPFVLFARQHGEQIWSDEGGLGFSKETLVEWWEYVVDLTEAEAMLSPERSLEENTHDGDSFAQGKMAFKPGWATQLGQVGELNESADLQLLRMPGEDGAEARGDFVKPSMHYSIAESSEHKEAAAKLIDFIVNSPEAGEILGADRGLPPNAEVLAEIQDGLGVADQKAAAYLTERLEEPENPRPLPPEGASEINAIFLRLSQEVLYGNLSPDAAADQLIAETEAAIG